MRAWTLMLASCAALLVPAAAFAARCAPPGVSGVNQYVETVPGAGCNGSSSGGGGGGQGGSGQGGHLPAGTGHQLAGQGATGRAVARLVASSGTAPGTNGSLGGSNSGTHRGGNAGSSGAGANAHVPASNGRDFLSALLHPILSGSALGGAGFLLPLFLAGAIVLTLGGVVLRRRRLSH